MPKLTEVERVLELRSLRERLIQAIEKTPRGITSEEIQKVWKEVCDKLLN